MITESTVYRLVITGRTDITNPITLPDHDIVQRYLRAAILDELRQLNHKPGQSSRKTPYTSMSGNHADMYLICRALSPKTRQIEKIAQICPIISRHNDDTDESTMQYRGHEIKVNAKGNRFTITLPELEHTDKNPAPVKKTRHSAEEILRYIDLYEMQKYLMEKGDKVYGI